MGVIASAVACKANSSFRRSDIALNPLPLGVPFGVPLVVPDEVKERAEVFGLTFARPCATLVFQEELQYDDELQLALRSLDGDWDGSILPRMVTIAGSIEQTPATGTIVSTGEPACPDRSPDSDASDRDRD
ncbi:hypothetical protein AB0K60_10210 [Thermopolyspora sp. NPDC052614]|uniref:hypothetical protein n=1 Tax=Thermopolyspora sp. NPDC052614 TaxID=3155682 RepID=UPI0034293655